VLGLLFLVYSAGESLNVRTLYLVVILLTNVRESLVVVCC